MTNTLEKLFEECRKHKFPPVHLWNPEHCGDIGLKIDLNGQWYYRESPIMRQPMVRLFSTILRLEQDGSYVLVTPVEKISIDVEDVPFIAVELSYKGEGQQQEILVRTNIDDVVRISSEHPVVFHIDPENQGVKPYIDIRNGLKARLTRSMTYDLLDNLHEEAIDGKTCLGVWSSGEFFPLMQTQAIE